MVARVYRSCRAFEGGTEICCSGGKGSDKGVFSGKGSDVSTLHRNTGGARASVLHFAGSAGERGECDAGKFLFSTARRLLYGDGEGEAYVDVEQNGGVAKSMEQRYGIQF